MVTIKCVYIRESEMAFTELTVLPVW